MVPYTQQILWHGLEGTASRGYLRVMLSRRGKGWMMWCGAMALLAAGGTVKLCDYLGVPDLVSYPLTTFVLGSAIYFFAYGVERNDKLNVRKRPGFPKDPFAPS